MLASWTYSYTLMPGFGRPPPQFMLLLVLLIPFLLGACSTPRRVPAADDPAVQRFARSAYQAEMKFTLDSLSESWTSRDPAAPDEIAVNLSLPREAGVYPLIVYLPGLGEPAESGQRWRTAWAEAGYAVLALQPRRFGPGAMQGAYARDADFTSLAREHYATAALGERLRAVRSVLFELQQRVDRKQAPYDRIDPAQLAVAGYDLGAQTAQALAGERVPGLESPTLPHAVRAAILISPYANLAAGGFSRRFGEMQLPTLLASSLDDSDSFGLVTSTAARTAPFTYMPAGDKYLLLLASASHRSLSGDERPSGSEEGEAAPRVGRGDQGGPGRGGMPPGGGPGGGMGGGDMGGGRSGMGGMSGGPGGAPTGSGDGRGRGPVDDLRQRIAVQRTSLAFLDASLRRDPIAAEWLARDVERWLGQQGEWRRK